MVSSATSHRRRTQGRGLGRMSRRERTRIILRELAQVIAPGCCSGDVKVKRKRARKVRRDPSSSAWACLLKHAGVDDPGHRVGKLFRRRFRVPYPIFAKIVALLEDKPDFAASVDALGRPSAPLELKVLAALRVLGRGECFDTCEELSGISSSCLTAFFHRFIHWLAQQYPTWVRLPTTDREIERVLRQYDLLGFQFDSSLNMLWTTCGWLVVCSTI